MMKKNAFDIEPIFAPKIFMLNKGCATLYDNQLYILLLLYSLYNIFHVQCFDIHYDQLNNDLLTKVKEKVLNINCNYYKYTVYLCFYVRY